MPELMKKPDQGKKPRTMPAEDKLDLPSRELPRDIPTSDTVLAKGRKRYQSPMSKVDSGDVPMQSPSAASNKSVSMGRMAQDLMASIPDEDAEDEAPKPIPPVESTLPAIISTALSTTPGEIKSYQMANILAPNPNKGKLAKMMHDQFSMFTEKPMGLTLKDIYSISSWTNDKYEIQAMAAWIFMHGDKVADNITTNIDAMPGYLPKASLWEDRETETRFLIVRETPEDLAGENTIEGVDEMLEEEDANIAENLRGRRPREDQCLYYIYAWSEPKNHLEGAEIKRELESIALEVARKFPGQTVREAYEKLEWEYLREVEKKNPPVAKAITPQGRWVKKRASHKPEYSKFTHGWDGSDKRPIRYNQETGDIKYESTEGKKCIQCDVKLPSGGQFSKKGLGPFCPACYKHEIGGEKVKEDTEKVKGGYENIGPHKKTPKGKARKHHKFGSKHGADQQRKAMFANGYHESVDEELKELTWGLKANKIKLEHAKPEEVAELKQDIKDIEQEIAELKSRKSRKSSD